MMSLISDNLYLIGFVGCIIIAPFALFAWGVTIVSVLNEAAENIHQQRHENSESTINQRSKS